LAFSGTIFIFTTLAFMRHSFITNTEFLDCSNIFSFHEGYNVNLLTQIVLLLNIYIIIYIYILIFYFRFCNICYFLS
jgi:hypothetical protein